MAVKSKVKRGETMKKYSWVFALILALTMVFVFTGCPADPDETTTTTGPGTVEPPPVVRPPVDPDAEDIIVTFGSAANQTQIKKDGDNNGAIDPGTLSYITNGYQYAYGTGSNTNYGNVVLRFKLDLEYSLANYGKISFDWEAIAPVYNNNNSVNSNKRLYLYATDTEADITPYVENKDLIVSPINATQDWYAGTQPAPLVNGSGVQHVEMEIVYSDRLDYLDGEVWFAIYTHAEGGTYKVTNVKFHAGEQTIAPVVPGPNFPPQPPTIADVPADFIALELDLEDWNTASPAFGDDTGPSTVPVAVFADGKLTVPFTVNNQRVNFKFDASQLADFAARGNNDVYVNINATITSGTGDSFRYHIGDALVTADWNATGSLDAFALADIAISTPNKGIKLNANANLEKQGGQPTGYFILNHRSADAITLQISSITIYVAPPPTAPAKILAFAEGDVKTRNGIVTLEADGSGFTFKSDGENYERAWAYFKVTFEDGFKLSDYSKIDYKVAGITNADPPDGSSDLGGYKSIFIAVFADEDEIDALPNDGSDDSKMPDSAWLSGNPGWSGGGIGALDGEPALKTRDIDKPDRVEEVDGNEVWIAIRTGASEGFIFTIKDIKFY
jgi:hypothetical protein